MKRAIRLLASCLLLIGSSAGTAEEVVVIGHPAIAKTDKATLQRIYTGRAVSIGAQVVAPVNLPPGNPARDEFLLCCMEQSEEQYTGYWLVRRYVGKGAPPLELANIDDVVKFVQATPGAIGYVPASKLPRSANVIFRR